MSRSLGWLTFVASCAAASIAFAQAPKPGAPPTPTVGAPPPPAAAMPPAPPAKPAAPAPEAKPAPPPAAAPAAAAAPKPPANTQPAPPKPAPELAQLKFLEGGWRCDGKAPAGPFGPEHAYKSSFKVKKDLSDFWYVMDYEQKKSKDHPLPVKGHGHVGFDTAAKKFVALGVDNVGGWITETSPGWEGDKLVWTGEGSVLGQKIGFRETFTKKSDKALVWTAEMKMAKDWVLLGTDTCKR